MHRIKLYKNIHKKQTIDTKVLLSHIKFIVCHPTTTKISYIAVLDNDQEIKANFYLKEDSYKAILIKEDGSKDIDFVEPKTLYYELRERFILQNKERAK